MNTIEIGLLVTVGIILIVLWRLWVDLRRAEAELAAIDINKVSQHWFDLERANRRDLGCRLEALKKYLGVKEYTTRAEVVMHKEEVEK